MSSNSHTQILGSIAVERNPLARAAKSLQMLFLITGRLGLSWFASVWTSANEISRPRTESFRFMDQEEVE
jgi:hypothetical protein